MNIERIDHIHIKTDRLDETTDAFKRFISSPFLTGLDFTEPYGMKVSFCPFPFGVELMNVSDCQKQMGQLYNAAPEGVFAISYKVPELDEGVRQMENIGFPLIMRYEFGEIKEAIFDTKKKLGVYIELIEYQAENIQDAKTNL